MSSERKIWHGIKSRCRDTSNPNYGGRGIGVCAGWDRSFGLFLECMGPRPTPLHSVDRIDNDGGYWCGSCEDCRAEGRQLNCRWATKSQQRRNAGDSVKFTVDGVTRPLMDWCELVGISRYTAIGRMRRGWPVRDAVTTPPGAVRHLEQSGSQRLVEKSGRPVDVWRMRHTHGQTCKP